MRLSPFKTTFQVPRPMPRGRARSASDRGILLSGGRHHDLTSMTIVEVTTTSGTTTVINTSDGNAAATVIALTDNRGVDAAMEAPHHPHTSPG
jgi:hypothetical protein